MADQANGEEMAGEAGQRGQDRQPVKSAGNRVQGTAPEGAQVAGAGQVKGRSKAAKQGMKGGQARKDQLDPAPSRQARNWTKGDVHAHHHETEPSLKKQQEKL